MWFSRSSWYIWKQYVTYEGLINRLRTTQAHIKTQQLNSYRASRQGDRRWTTHCYMVALQGRFPEAIKAQSTFSGGAPPRPVWHIWTNTFLCGSTASELAWHLTDRERKTAGQCSEADLHLLHGIPSQKDWRTFKCKIILRLRLQREQRERWHLDLLISDT